MLFLFITMVILLVRFHFIRFILDYNFRMASQKIACKGMVIYILALNLLEANCSKKLLALYK